MTDARASSSHVSAVTGTIPDARLSQGYVTAVVTSLSEQSRASTLHTSALTTGVVETRTSNMYVTAVVGGVIGDPTVRAWTYTIDGHDVYVLKLGETETIVYDTNSEQWSVFGSGTKDVWDLSTGVNWIGGNAFATTYGSNVVAGDPYVGTLYFLSPEYPYDEDSSGTQVPFERVAQGFIPIVGRDKMRCNGVQVTGSLGNIPDTTLAEVELFTSDDAGNTYDSQGTVTVPLSDFNMRADWLSLGSMQYPGRLFKLVDSGSIVRIDSLEMYDAPEGSR